MNCLLPQRRSPRLKNYGYTQEGAYFVTICTYQRQHLFGDILGENMRQNQIGAIAEMCWLQIPDHFPHVELDAAVIMPNHMHGIILIGAKNCSGHGGAVSLPAREMDFVGTRHAASATIPQTEQFGKPVAGSLSTILRSYKSAVSRKVREEGLSVDHRIWQGRFHDHIIRSERGLNVMRQYVLHNVTLWSKDEFY